MSGVEPVAAPTEDNEPDGMLAYALARANPSKDDPSWPLPSFDARDWAAAFCQIAEKNGHPGIDEGWMIGWFANALMRGFDEANDRAAAASTSVEEKLREVLDRAAMKFEFYEQQHRRKGTSDADEKAKVNNGMAAMCRNAIAGVFP